MLRTLLSGLIVLALSAPALAADQAAPAKPAPPSQSATPTPVPPAQTQDQNLGAYVELLRSDIRSQKVAILTELMNFTEAEDTAFWPIYREYDVELNKLNDERVALDQGVRRRGIPISATRRPTRWRTRRSISMRAGMSSRSSTTNG